MTLGKTAAIWPFCLTTDLQTGVWSKHKNAICSFWIRACAGAVVGKRRSGHLLTNSSPGLSFCNNSSFEELWSSAADQDRTFCLFINYYYFAELWVNLSATRGLGTVGEHKLVALLQNAYNYLRSATNKTDIFLEIYNCCICPCTPANLQQNANNGRPGLLSIKHTAGLPIVCTQAAGLQNWSSSPYP